MYRSGSFVADQLDGVGEDQVQPNGVDLTLAEVYEQRGPGRVSRDGKEIGDRQALVPEERESVPESEASEGSEEVWNDASGGTATFYLPPGGYIVQYAETVSIPEGHVGFIYPRSTLMRNSCMLNTAVWDAGYTGKGEGLLQVHHDIEIERGARIAQLVLAEGQHDDTYAGSYQGENVDREGGR